MLAGVSHDLRTPLTRMKLQLEMLEDVPEAQYLQADVAEMEHMVEGYLAFARGEGREMPAPTDLAGLLRDVVAQMTRDGRTVDLHVEQDLMLPLRREARSEEHTSELQSLMRISYAVFCLKKKKPQPHHSPHT